MPIVQQTSEQKINLAKKYTVEEYLTLEEKAEYKSEYRNGEIISMAGGTINHNEIAGNIYASLKFALKKQNYRVFISDVKLWIPKYKIYTYPDVMIVSGEPIYEGENNTTITNPLIIIEVLSLSTQEYDRGQKFKYYRSIPYLNEYILIDQYEYGIEHFAKNQEQKWVLTEYKSQEEILKLESISWEINLSDIYEQVNFAVEISK